MPARKQTISSPLEAGPSILDAHRLPGHVLPALDFASARLARKNVHLTLVVVRSDYQIPSPDSPLRSPGLSTPVTPSTPGRFSLKNIVRVASSHSLTSARSFDSVPTTPTCGAVTPRHVPKMRWPLTPSTPLSPPPMTPSTSASTDGLGPASAFGMRLVYAGGLRARDEKILKEALAKADQKFDLGGDWFSSPLTPAASGLSAQLLNSSLIQNEVLFASESLTLLSLDRLYRLKSALSSYHKTRSPMRLEDAVDELRRLVLATNGKQVTKSDLLRSYDWLSISSSAITDLDRMYRKAYGGPEQTGAISGLSSFAERTGREPFIRDDDEDEDEPAYAVTPVLMKMPPKGKPPSPHVPVLTLRTNFDPKPRVVVVNDDDDDGDRTACPTDRPLASLQPWSATIDQVLSAQALSPATIRAGPMTPNGNDDISPTTRGEWGFLMGGNTLANGRMVAIETF